MVPVKTIRPMWEILKWSDREFPTMVDDYIAELKDSVFQETPLVEADFDEDRRLVFDSKADAEEWVAEQNQRHTRMGELALHTAHPADTSDVDVYIVFQPVKGVWVPDS